MIRFTPLARTGAALAAGGLVLGLSAVPSGAQVEPSSPLLVSGEVACEVIEGDYLWIVGYAAENTIEPLILDSVPAAYGDITIDSAALTLDGTPIGSVDFVPNPVPMGTTAFDGGPIPGDVTGTLVLTVTWSAPDGPDVSGSETVALVLDDSCAAPVTTTTTAGPVVQAEAVAVTPAFTG